YTRPSEGSDPKLAPWPLTTSRSAIATFMPAPASAYVTSDPVPPPPMTNTSTRSMRFPLVIRRPRPFEGRGYDGGPMYSADEIRSRMAGVTDPAGGCPDARGERAAAGLVPVRPRGARCTRRGALLAVCERGAAARRSSPRRTDTLSRHAGEISFPGGLAD